MKVGARIKLRRQELDISVDAIAAELGKNRATIYRYESNDIENLPTTVLEPLADILQTTPSYLMGWTDDPIDYDEFDEEIPSHFNGDVKKFIQFEDAVAADVRLEEEERYRFLNTVLPSEIDGLTKYREIDAYGQETVSYILDREYNRTMEKEKQKEQKSNIIPLRLVSYYYKNASAGTGQIIFDTPPTKQIEIPNIPKYACVSYAIGVDGNSMQPTYNDGDTLLIEVTKELGIGDIGIFQVNGDCFVKKLGESELISLNKDYINIPLNESASCMGKVIGKLEN